MSERTESYPQRDPCGPWGLHSGPWYEWPSSADSELGPQLFSAPCEGFIWGPSEFDRNIFVPVGLAPPKPKWVAEEPPCRTALYRFFSDSAVLLYVGISCSPERRWVNHAETKPWWPEVSRIDFAWHASRAEALWREVEAIRTERPLHNVQHNKRAA